MAVEPAVRVACSVSVCPALKLSDGLSAVLTLLKLITTWPLPVCVLVSDSGVTRKPSMVVAVAG